MGHAAEFLEQFQADLDRLPLPDRIRSAWRPETCLSRGGQGEVWLLSGRETGEQAALKIRPAEGIDLEEEYRLLERLPEDLAGQVPRPLDFFREGGRQYLLRTYLPGRTLEQAGEEEPDRVRQLCVPVGAEMCRLLERRLSTGISSRRTSSFRRTGNRGWWTLTSPEPTARSRPPTR